MRSRNTAAKTRRAISFEAIFKNVPVLDTGARGSTMTFVERGIGDVLIAWENEAFLSINEFGKDKFEIVVPVAVHSGRAAGRGGRQGRRQEGHARGRARPISNSSTRREGQEIAAKHFYRPRDPAIAAKYERSFPKVELFTIDEVFGGWRKAQTTHFADGGVFDQIYSAVTRSVIDTARALRTVMAHAVSGSLAGSSVLPGFGLTWA